MGKGDPVRLKRWLGQLLLSAGLACAPASAAELELARLPTPAEPAEVIAGALDDRFVAVDGRVIYEQSQAPVWWRVRSAVAVPADDAPQLLLESPYLSRVAAWVPGAKAPTRHAIYGQDNARTYSQRALVVPLPDGLAAGRAVYLLLDAPSAVPMAVSVDGLDQVHRADLGYVAWRSVILTSILILAVLAVAFWVGSGDRSYVFLTVTLGGAAVYLAAMGGEARHVPGLGDLVAAGPQLARVAAGVGTMGSNAFMRGYLDLGRTAPVLDRLLLWLTYAMGAVTIASAFVDQGALAVAGNGLLVLSCLTVLAAGIWTAWKGERAARFLLASWLPLIVFAIARALELTGLYAGPAWLSHALAASFALAGLLLTIGLSDKLLQLRRDRDLASHAASTDALTGALSRSAIEQRLEEQLKIARATGRSLSVAFIDIDRFKQINDTHGHHVGDACLRSIGQRVRNRLRTQDLLGRYGGDELLVVMPDTSLGDGLALAQLLRSAVSHRPVAIDGLLVESSLSIGMAQLLQGEGTRDLLARADAALYESKTAGRDRVSASFEHTVAQEVAT